MDEHGSAEAALEALPGIASAAGVARYTPCTLEAAQHELARGEQLGATLLLHGTPDYPQALMDIDDAPPLLWAMGNISLANRASIAMVGARNASSLGTRMAHGLANDLGNAGYMITSGLARGVDTAAHIAALPHGTVAVVAGGLDVVYPRENAKLHDDIAKRGLILSERPLGLQPQARDFPRRNRIISGLSRAVVVVEAAAKSGSLITARNALDQGRDVMAVPGHPLDPRAAGCNMLIRDGAALVRSPQDVLASIGAPQPPLLPERAALPARPPVHPHGPAHAQILGLLGPTPMAEDQLLRDLKVDAGTLAPHLTMLELEGKIERQPGGLLTRLI
ncbi:Rossmann fold nucleotide-binding protein Smf possibly involved in DNA uptake [Litoreibacter arenae DSM 19593]|uniref:Rossmann fold nucleotide-binding protein Smf possibly involved in DNA uptake n=2 Tax=Litoreibacter TaxID=947567 RepID=S9QLT8_9RHOB|nr:Rossmann fold nucleotide-binding protein Smf possibly involved in DNA uptake [Litoreibacter arenae DSM 19593]